MADTKAKIDAAVKKLKKIHATAITKTEGVIEKYGIVVESAAKRSFKGRNAPSVYNEPPRVQTGRLRASITHEAGREDGEYFQLVGTNVEYAKAVEFGTSDTMPHPFLSYALGMYEREITAAVAEAIKEAANA